MQKFEVDGIKASAVDPKTGAVNLVFDVEGAEHVLVLKSRAVADLLTAMHGMPLTPKGQADTEFTRPLYPRAIYRFRIPQGPSGISFQIADRLALPVAMSKQVIAVLRRLLDDLEAAES